MINVDENDPNVDPWEYRSLELRLLEDRSRDRRPSGPFEARSCECRALGCDSRGRSLECRSVSRCRSSAVGRERSLLFLCPVDDADIVSEYDPSTHCLSSKVTKLSNPFVVGYVSMPVENRESGSWGILCQEQVSPVQHTTLILTLPEQVLELSIGWSFQALCIRCFCTYMYFIFDKCIVWSLVAKYTYY